MGRQRLPTAILQLTVIAMQIQSSFPIVRWACTKERMSTDTRKEGGLKDPLPYELTMKQRRQSPRDHRQSSRPLSPAITKIVTIL